MIKLLILLIAFLGYSLFYIKYINNDIAFFPILFASGATLITYIGGLFGNLLIPCYLVGIAGIILFIASLINTVRGKEFAFLLQHVAAPSMLFMVFACIWGYIITKGVVVSRWDDCSHWYRIVKMMHVENALPTKGDMLFPSYVPGSGVWVYFLTRYIGYSVSKCFFAQVVLNVFCCVSLFSLIKWNDNYKKPYTWVKLIMCILMPVLLCAMNTSTYTLQVDTVLALVPMSGFIMIINAENDINSLNKLFWPLLFVICFTALIKTSGLLFAIIVVLAWFLKCSECENIVEITDNQDKRTCICKLLIGTVSPIAFFVSYMIRVHFVYGNVSDSMQAVSASRYMSVIKGKSFSNIAGVARKYLYETFNITDAISQIKIIWLCILIIIAIRMLKSKGDYYSKSIILFIESYYLGLFITYICSLADYEANALACFYRYIGSASIFIFGTLVFYLIKSIITDEYNMSNNEGNTEIHGKAFNINAIAYIIAVVMIVPAVYMFDTGYVLGFEFYNDEEDYTQESWKQMENLLEEKWQYEGGRYIVMYDPYNYEGDISYKIPMELETYLRAEKVYEIMAEDVASGNVESHADEIAQSDYLITLTDFSEHADIIEANLPIAEYKPGMCAIVH